VPAGKATDALRDGMKAALAKAQQTRSQAVGVGALCALHQFGETAPFDQYKAALEKQAASEKEEEKVAAQSSLAVLHYELREYEVAAGYYQAQIAAQEKAPKPPEDLPNTMYNAACCLSLAGKIDEGLAMLEKGLVAGAKARALAKPMIDSDHDMNNLRADPRFQKLMEQHFGAGAGK
jgi:tetratricopeptide (TPR) repeat protein